MGKRKQQGFKEKLEKIRQSDKYFIYLCLGDEWEKKKAVIKLAVGKQFGTCYLIGKFNNNILI